MTEFCEHLRDLISYCKEKEVGFGGCGCDGSPWVYCNTCKIIIENAADVLKGYDKTGI